MTCTLEGRKTGKHKYEYTYTIEAYNCVPFKTTYAKDEPSDYLNLSRIVDSSDTQYDDQDETTDSNYPFTIKEADGIIHLKDALVDKYYARRDSAASSIQVLAAIQIIKEINYRQSPNRNQNIYDEDELVLDKTVIVGQILD